MIKTIGLVNAYYESSSVNETVKIMTDLLALEKIGEEEGEVTLKHPNTDWPLIVHDGGPDAPLKYRFLHKGVRVTTNREIDDAHEYLKAKAKEYRIKVDKIQSKHEACSVHFLEPGGNWWEIESCEDAVKQGLGANITPPWQTPLPPEKFPGRGYVPQALTHGTFGVDNLEASRVFYREVLGLETYPLPHDHHVSHYFKHPTTPWYIVVLQIPIENRMNSYPFQRYTVAVESVGAVEEAHRELKDSKEKWGLTQLEQIRERSSGAVAFLLCDRDTNWWEISSPLS